MSGWLTFGEGAAPLVISIPHAGDRHPRRYRARLVSAWLARKDTDWWVDRLYDSAGALDATIMQHGDLADGHRRQPRPLRRLALPWPGDDRALPDHDVRRRAALSRRPGTRRGRNRTPKGALVRALSRSLVDRAERLRGVHDRVVLYDGHSIRSSIPRLFEGILPHFNIGTNGGASCAPELTSGRRGRVRRDIVHSRHQRAVSGRLYHPPSWQSGKRCACDPDGARLPGLSARTDRARRRDELAARL